MGFEDTRAEGNYNIQYSSGIADDIVRDRVFSEHRDPHLRQKQSPHNWSTRGSRKLNQRIALKTIRRITSSE